MAVFRRYILLGSVRFGKKAQRTKFSTGMPSLAIEIEFL
jgi:hypothetical protein